jgi:hypothetical protein
MSVLPDDRLTAAPFDRAARATHAGMAHFAGSGPLNVTCRECLFWAHDPRGGYSAKRGMFGGLIKPAPCRKYRELTGRNGAPVPDDAPACRHFQCADKLPPRTK